MSEIETSEAEVPDSINEVEKDLGRREIRDMLVNLDTEEALWRQRGEDYRTMAEVELRQAKEKLQALYKIHGDDPALRELAAMYEDLMRDFELGSPLDIDESIVQSARVVHEEMEASGIRALTQEELDDKNLSSLAKRLLRLGLSVEYAVPAFKEGAPTVILMPQIHPNPGMSQELMEVAGVLTSQDNVFQSIRRLESDGVTDTVLAEGIPLGIETTRDDAALNPHFGYSRAKLELGDRVYVRGFEDPAFLKKTLLEVDDKIGATLRQTAQNLVIAENIISSISDHDTAVAVVVIGANHEMDLLGNLGGNHPFPLSRVIARSGVNVIVVNRPRFNRAEFESFLKKHPDLLRSAKEGMQNIGMQM